MKLSQKFGLLLLIVLGLAGWVKAAQAQSVAIPVRKTRWEYWVEHGTAGVIIPGMGARLNEGYEIDRLETTAPADGKAESYIVVVLKREKAM